MVGLSGVFSVYDLTPITQIAALSTLVGGVLFGLGIVMASGCETGMMYRLMDCSIVNIELSSLVRLAPPSNSYALCRKTERYNRQSISFLWLR